MFLTCPVNYRFLIWKWQKIKFVAVKVCGLCASNELIKYSKFLLLKYIMYRKL